MKNLLFLLIVLAFFASCKTKSGIVTSKAEAEKRGIYTAPLKTKIAATKLNKENSIKKKTSKKNKKKSLIKEENDDDYVVSTENTSYLVEQLINSTMDNIGVNYRDGGTTKDGFDCSGLMYVTFKNYNISLPRTSLSMSKTGTKLSREEIQKGDLIFFKTNGRGVINHVGMVIEVINDEIKFIHSSTTSGVIISSTKEEYYSRAFSQGNRVL